MTTIFLQPDPYILGSAGSGGGGEPGTVNLGVSRNATTVTVTNDGGTNAVISSASGSLAGAMPSADFVSIGDYRAGKAGYDDAVTYVSRHKNVQGFHLDDLAPPTGVAENYRFILLHNSGETRHSGWDSSPFDVINVNDIADTNDAGVTYSSIAPSNWLFVYNEAEEDDWIWNGTIWYAQAEPGDVALSVTYTDSAVTIVNSVGANAVVATATDSNAGVMSSSIFTSFGAIESAYNASRNIQRIYFDDEAAPGVVATNYRFLLLDGSGDRDESWDAAPFTGISTVNNVLTTDDAGTSWAGVTPTDGLILYNEDDNISYLWDASAWGSTATDLGATYAVGTVTITSSTGTNVEISAATDSQAGVMSKGLFDDLTTLKTYANLRQDVDEVLFDHEAVPVAQENYRIVLLHLDGETRISAWDTLSVPVNSLAFTSDTGVSWTVVAKSDGMEVYSIADDLKYFWSGVGWWNNAIRNTDLAMGGSGDDRTITSSTGTNATLVLADESTAGLLPSGKLAEIAASTSYGQITGEQPDPAVEFNDKFISFASNAVIALSDNTAIATKTDGYVTYSTIGIAIGEGITVDTASKELTIGTFLAADIGKPVYLDTAGGVTKTRPADVAGTFIQIVGKVIATDKILVNIEQPSFIYP